MHGQARVLLSSVSCAHSTHMLDQTVASEAKTAWLHASQEKLFLQFSHTGASWKPRPGEGGGGCTFLRP